MSSVPILPIQDDSGEKKKKSKLDPLLSSASQTWNTPDSLFAPLNALWKFKLDVACLAESALCSRYFTPDDDGLAQTWGITTAWCNPPYDNIKGWAEKCNDSFQHGTTVVMLIPSRTDTVAFHSFIFGKATAVCFLKGRLKFANPTENEKANNSAPFPSCLVIYDNDLNEEKVKYLNSIGVLMYSK